MMLRASSFRTALSRLSRSLGGGTAGQLIDISLLAFFDPLMTSCPAVRPAYCGLDTARVRAGAESRD